MLCANLLLIGTGMLDDEGVRDLQERVNVVTMVIITSTCTSVTNDWSKSENRKAERGNVLRVRTEVGGVAQ